MPRLGTELPCDGSLGTGEEALLARAEHLAVRHPKDPMVNRALAALYLRRGALRRALLRLKAVFDVQGHDPEAMGLLAAYFQVQGESDKAMSVWRELAARPADEQARGVEGYRRGCGTLPVPGRLTEQSLDDVVLLDLVTH